MRAPAALTFPFLGSLRLVHRNDRPLIFRQKMTESENRVTPVLDVVACGYRNAAMTQGFTRRQESVTGVNLRAKFFSERVQRRLRINAL